ncbi:hypothetical protein SMG44B_30361 [Stenotrophomonas maltophilia]
MRYPSSSLLYLRVSQSFAILREGRYDLPFAVQNYFRILPCVRRLAAGLLGNLRGFFHCR